ncbi:MAG: hypothetical protein ACHQIL_02890 [Steroidobacterales bacterium]
MDTSSALPDRLTLIAVSALAYVVAVALHEHLGHAAACVLLGSSAVELGAFYVNCDNTMLDATSVRLVALAGPLMSLLTGIVCFRILRAINTKARVAWYFTWLLGSLRLMTATGYPVFSGISGLGDLGGDADGALHGVAPEWSWRSALVIIGVASYFVAVRSAARALDPRISGNGTDRIRSARLVTLISYLTGGAVYLAIGLLNPYGFVIMVTSALASSLGGTSGLLWMRRLLDRVREVPPPGLSFPRSWPWIGAALAAVAAYGLVLGPTLRP